MSYVQHGNILVPAGYHARSASVSASATMDGLHENSLALLYKSFGSSLRSTPHQLLTYNNARGLYQGIKDPGMATLRTFEFLKRIASVLFPRTIIGRLVGEAMTYGRISRGTHERGLRLRLRDRAASPRPQDRIAITAIERVLEDGGIWSQRKSDGAWGVWDKAEEERADDFHTLLQKLLWDSLIMDWAALRIEAGVNPSRNPIAFMRALDASRVRLTEQKPKRAQLDASGNVRAPWYENQIRNDIVVEAVEIDETGHTGNEYAYSEIVTMVRNHRTDFAHLGYGWPELASCVEYVAGLLTAVDYNVKTFTHDRRPPGMGIISGATDEGWLREFLFQMSQAGTDGYQGTKMPILFGDDTLKMQYVPFHTNEKMDMYWSKWIGFVVAALAGAFHIAAEEVNFQAFLQVGGQLGNNGSDDRAKLVRSHGFQAVMQSTLRVINRDLVSRFHADSTGRGPFEAEWTGMEDTDQEKERVADTQDLQSGFATVNQILARRDQRQIRDPKDPDLYREIAKRTTERYPELARYHDQLSDFCEKTYEDMGGKWALWPDAPANPSLLPVWQQEHADQLGGGAPQPGDPQEQQGMPFGDQGDQGQPQGDAGEDDGVQAQQEFQQGQGGEEDPQGPRTGQQQPVQKSLAKRTVRVYEVEVPSGV